MAGGYGEGGGVPKWSAVVACVGGLPGIFRLRGEPETAQVKAAPSSGRIEPGFGGWRGCCAAIEFVSQRFGSFLKQLVSGLFV